MTKEIVEVKDNQIDAIISVAFRPLYEAGENHRDTPVYIDETKTLCKGKYQIGNIYFTLPIYGEQGICNYQKLYLTKQDIIDIYNRINDIEARDPVGYAETYLPF